MRVYLAAQYARREELRTYANDLKQMGVQVTSRWLHQNYEELPADSAERSRLIAAMDYHDVRQADVLVFFGSTEYTGAGGCFTELGMALGLDRKVVIVGARTQHFHHLAQIRFFETWPQVLEHLARSLRAGRGKIRKLR